MRNRCSLLSKKDAAFILTLSVHRKQITLAQPETHVSPALILLIAFLILGLFKVFEDSKELLLMWVIYILLLIENNTKNIGRYFQCT